ncbi:MAG: tRNA (adenosine(37)-N6)-dimethylallyltransferase MiaA [Treponema sp.]
MTSSDKSSAPESSVFPVGVYNSIIVLGTTASGKTSVGVQLARAFDGEIISADSRQVYIGLDIGSGKDLSEYSAGGKAVPYHLIDIADLREREYNVFDYQQDFYRAFADIRARGKLPIVAGGTGMYLDAVVRNYDFVEVPENPSLRAELEEKTLSELGKMLLALKPDLHNKSDLLIRERVVRAIEIARCMQSPQAASLRKNMTPRPDIRPLIFGIKPERSLLREKIALRLKERLEAGMVEEVKNLHEAGCTWDKLERLGLEYKFCSQYLQGIIASRGELFEKLNIAIRQFAKRQETWFKRMEKCGVEIRWLTSPEDKTLLTQEAIKEAAKYFAAGTKF